MPYFGEQLARTNLPKPSRCDQECVCWGGAALLCGRGVRRLSLTAPRTGAENEGSEGEESVQVAALYLDSSLKCEQVGTGDSPSRLGSLRPSVSRGVARSRSSSKVRTVGRGRKPASCKVGSRRAGAEEAQ